MDINSLPDVVLRKIFSILPLIDQFHLHHVCPKWQSLQPSVTSTQKFLTLFVGWRTDPDPRFLITNSPLTLPYLDQIESNSSRKYPQESTLQYSKLHDSLTTHLVSLFPNIRSLCLVLNETGYETVDQDVIQLLESWSKSLESLSFYCYNYHFDESPKQIFKLIDCINQKCLKINCLTLDVRVTLYDLDEVGDSSDLDLPCLARLKEFHFNSFDDANILFKSLKQYAKHDRLERISIGNDCDLTSDVVTEFAQNPQIAAKLVIMPYLNLPKRHKIINTFKSLTALSFSLDFITLPEFTSYLAPLHSLLYLQIVITNKGTKKLSLSKYDATPTYEFQRLPTVKILSLSIKARTHDDLKSRHWSTIFPSVQVVQLIHSGGLCKKCHVQLNKKCIELNEIEQNKRDQCLRMLIGPLKQCAKLKKIEIDDLYGIFGSVGRSVEMEI